MHCLVPFFFFSLDTFFHFLSNNQAIKQPKQNQTKQNFLTIQHQLLPQNIQQKKKTFYRSRDRDRDRDRRDRDRSPPRGGGGGRDGGRDRDRSRDRY